MKFKIERKYNMINYPTKKNCFTLLQNEKKQKKMKSIFIRIEIMKLCMCAVVSFLLVHMYATPTTTTTTKKNHAGNHK